MCMEEEWESEKIKQQGKVVSSYELFTYVNIYTSMCNNLQKKKKLCR